MAGNLVSRNANIKNIHKSKSGNKKYHGVMLALLIIVLASLALYDYFFSGNPEVKSGDAATYTPPKTPTKDNLKELALSEEDAQGYFLLNESSQLSAYKDAIASYSVIFDNKGSNPTDYTNYKRLYNTILLYNSLDDLKKDFNKEDLIGVFPATFKEVKIESIGDESFAFSGDLHGVNTTYIWFRKGNTIVKIQLIYLIDVEEAVLYAKRAEAK